MATQEKKCVLVLSFLNLYLNITMQKALFLFFSVYSVFNSKKAINLNSIKTEQLRKVFTSLYE